MWRWSSTSVQPPLNVNVGPVGPATARRRPPDGDPGPAEDDEQEDERQAGGHSRALPDGTDGVRGGGAERAEQGSRIELHVTDQPSCDGR